MNASCRSPRNRTTLVFMTNNETLTGRVAVVTGASSGIGAATARRLAGAGARVALIGRRDHRIKEIASEIDGFAVAADVTDLASLQGAAASIRAALGPVDIVVANAGVMLAAPYESAQTAEWEQMVGTNVTGLLYTGRVFVDDLIAAAGAGGKADLVHVGSIGGHIVLPNYSVYTATKAAVAHLTRNLRAEFGPRGVRVKNVEPGLVATELGDGMRDEDQRKWLADFREQYSMLDPGDIADAIAFAVAAPARMNVAELIVVPTTQG